LYFNFKFCQRSFLLFEYANEASLYFIFKFCQRGFLLFEYANEAFYQFDCRFCQRSFLMFCQRVLYFVNHFFFVFRWRTFLGAFGASSLPACLPASPPPGLALVHGGGRGHRLNPLIPRGRSWNGGRCLRPLRML
jgi:hypothetical protein